jgi:hypothetical protein
MVEPHPEFKRILVGLHHRTAGESMRCAAEVAALLRLDLLGLFVQEDRLIQLAALPFAREFRPLGGWRQMEIEQLSHDLDLAAKSAQRMFSQAIRGLSTACQFEVVRGSLAETIESTSRGGDIVIVSEPVSPGNHVTEELSILIDAAFRSASAVMLVPRRVARQSGSVVAVAGTPDDAAIRVASAIAARAREDLTILDTAPKTDYARHAETGENSRMNAARIPVSPEQLSHASGIKSVFRQLHERLVVTTRGTLSDASPSMIASVRHDPVLIIGADIDRQAGADFPPQS